jgi:hypothetical protein
MKAGFLLNIVETQMQYGDLVATWTPTVILIANSPLTNAFC